MSRVLVTPRSLTAAPTDLLAPIEAAGHELVLGPAGRQPSEAELIGLVAGCAGWIAGVEPIRAPVFAAADALKVISRNGTGIDAIDLDAASARGVRVMVAAGANAQAVAELALAFILAGLRHVPESAAVLRAGGWHRAEGREIGGATVGVVGYGAIGRAVARMAQALGAAVLAHDIAPAAGGDGPAGGFTALDDLLARSDVVTLHCPALPGAAPLLDGTRLRLLKPGAGLVNTARASLVAEAPLLAALEEGRVGWYATDVFDVEPPPPSPLFAHPRVVATPHIGGFTAESGREAARVAIANLLRELQEAEAAGERRA